MEPPPPGASTDAPPKSPMNILCAYPPEIRNITHEEVLTHRLKHSKRYIISFDHAKDTSSIPGPQFFHINRQTRDEIFSMFLTMTELDTPLRLYNLPTLARWFEDLGGEAKFKWITIMIQPCNWVELVHVVDLALLVRDNEELIDGL